MKTSAKVIIGIGVIAALAAVVVVSRTRSNRDAVKVEAEPVERRSLVSVVEASGQIEPAVSVDISSDVIGRIVEMGADEGDRVTKGQFLIQVDPTQLQQRVSRLEAALATARTSKNEAEANLAIRESDFQRDRRLYEDNLLPRSKYEATQAAFEVAQAQLASAGNRILESEAGLSEVKDQLSRCRIDSPMDGVVIRKNAEVGEVAISGTLNNQGSLLMTIADLSVMITEVNVDETDVVNVELGQEVEVALDAFPSRTFEGEVTRIGNSAIQTATAPGQRQSADYLVEVTLLEKDRRIRPGLSATARINADRRDDVLAVPIQALLIREVGDDDEDAPSNASPSGNVVLAADTSSFAAEDESQDETTGADSADAAGDDAGAAAAEDEDDDEKEEVEGVFVVRDGEAVFVPVSTGIAGEKYFEVVDGLQAGDQVISGNFAALRKLKDGDAVEIQEPDKDDED